jgi:hypothetical protein
MSIVRAVQSAIITIDAAPLVIREGDAFNDDDPVVREHRWLFRSDVEQATASPGERRNARRL